MWLKVRQQQLPWVTAIGQRHIWAKESRYGQSLGQTPFTVSGLGLWCHSALQIWMTHWIRQPVPCHWVKDKVDTLDGSPGCHKQDKQPCSYSHLKDNLESQSRQTSLFLSCPVGERWSTQKTHTITGRTCQTGRRWDSSHSDLVSLRQHFCMTCQS